MRYPSLVSIYLYLLLCVAPAQAVEINLTEYIPGEYALLVVSGFDPGQPLDKKTIDALARGYLEKAGVEELQFAVYDAGRNAGDGVRAAGEIFKNKDKTAPYLEPAGEKAHLQEKALESLLGYTVTPEKLYAAYAENENAANACFKSKSVVMLLKVPQIDKDRLGRPYIKVSVDEAGLCNVQVNLDKTDPFLRKIKKGSNIAVKAYPRGLAMQTVVLDGGIIDAANCILIDGKAVPKTEVWGE